MFDEANSLESSMAPQAYVLALVPEDRNWWCIDGQYQIYREANFPNDKGVMTRLVTVEHRVFMVSLHTVPDV